MNKLITVLFSIFCVSVLATPPVTDQWELRQKTAGGFTSYGITAENGKAIGFTAGVPAMIATGGVTSIAISGSDGIEIDSGSPITSAGTIALGINISALKTHLSISNVENTALSTWAGTTNITTLGTIATGVWNGTVIGASYGGAGTVSGLLKANGSGTVSAASAGTDYLTPTGDGSGLTSLSASNISSGSLALARIAQSAATSGQALTWNGTAWAPTTISTGITIGTTAITSGTSGKLLYNNGGVVGEQTLGDNVATLLGAFTKTNLDTALSDDNVAYTGTANSFGASQTISGNTNRLYIGSNSISANGTDGRLYIHSNDGFGYSLIMPAKMQASGVEAGSWTSSDGQLNITHTTSAPFVFSDTGSHIFEFKSTTNPQTVRIYGNATGSKYLSLAHDGTNAVISASSGIVTVTVPQTITVAGAVDTSGLKIDGTWSIAGDTTTDKPSLLIEPAGATSTNWNTNGTGLGVNAASGFTGNLLDLQLNGSAAFKVSRIGDVTMVGGITLGANSFIYGSGAAGSTITMYGSVSDSVGEQVMVKANKLLFGGTAATNPGLKRSGTTLQVRLGDDSDYAPFAAGTTTVNGTWAASATAPALLVEDSTRATAFTGSASGTGIGVNAASAFVGNLIDAQRDGTSKFKVNKDGKVYFGGFGSVIGDLGSGHVYIRTASSDAFWARGGNNSAQVPATLYIGGTMTVEGQAFPLYRVSATELQFGEDRTSPAAVHTHAADKTGSDGAGANWTISPGNGLGGAGGSLILSTYDTGAAATPGTLRSRLTIDTSGNSAFTGPVSTSTSGSSSAYLYVDYGNYNTTTDTFTSTSHGMTDGTAVILASGGNISGAGTSSSPIYFPLYVPMYIVNSATNTFQVARTIGGTPYDMTAGSGGVYFQKIYPSPSISLAGTGFKTSTGSVTGNIELIAVPAERTSGSGSTFDPVLAIQRSVAGAAPESICYMSRTNGIRMEGVQSGSGILIATYGNSGVGYGSGGAASLFSFGSEVFNAGEGGVNGNTNPVALVPTIGSSNMVKMSYISHGVMQLGTDATTESPQTIKGHDGSGTDKDGADMTWEGGKSTGTGRGGDVITSTSLSATSTGSSLNSYSVRTYSSAKPVTLTAATATAIADIGLADAKTLGLRMNCTVMATDGTEYQAVNSMVSLSAVNKAGTVTVGTITQQDDGTAASSGTLTVTYSAAIADSYATVTGTASSDLLTATGHVLANGTPVRFTALNLNGGSAVFSTGVTYWVINSLPASNTFQLAATQGSSTAINFTANIIATTSLQPQAITVKANATSSLTLPSLRCKWQINTLNSDDSSVVNPR